MGARARPSNASTAVERFGHWLLATSFIILGHHRTEQALYGRYFLPDVLGAEAFTTISICRQVAPQQSVAWAFMLGLVIIFIAWVKDNIPGKIDLKWLAVGGGLFSKNVHPDSKKFNAGQKLIFWSTMLLGRLALDVGYRPALPVMRPR
jgi:formate dehydrogenase subunit gamma